MLLLLEILEEHREIFRCWLSKWHVMLYEHFYEFRMKHLDATCSHIVFMEDVPISRNSQLMLSLVWLDPNVSVLHVFQLSISKPKRKIWTNIARKWRISNLRYIPSQIRLKEKKLLSPPFACIKKGRSTSFANDLKLKGSRHPLNRRSSLLVKKQ